jgi:Na+-driven multidrug efflux pump
MTTSLVLNNLLRFQGNAFFSMVGLVAGAVLNFALAPLLIFVCGMGIAGAGLATIVCQLLSFVLLLVGLQRSGIVRLSRGALHPSERLYRIVANGGIPSFLRQVVFGFATICLNTAARPYGDAAIAGIAIVMRVVSIGNCVQIGLGQGFQPVCGFNYGARNFRRVREGYFFSVKAAFVVLAVMCAVAFAFAPQIVAIFRDDAEVIAVATITLRFQCVSLPFTGLAMLTNFMLQTTGKMWRASFLGVARLGIILAPTVFILASWQGLLGIEMAQSVSDAITLAITIPMAASLLREFDRRQEKVDALAARKAA